MWLETTTLFWQNLTKISPTLLGAGLILLFGILVAHWIGAMLKTFLDQIRLNQVLKRMGLEEALAKVDIRLDISNFFAQIAKWFFIILFLMAAAEILGLTQFSQVLEKVIFYFPNIFISALIFIGTVFLIDFAQKIVVGSLEKERITYSRFLGKGLSFAIWILATLAILYQLKIASTLILIIFIGVMAIIVLILGISFGLGGKDLAVKILKELEERLK